MSWYLLSAVSVFALSVGSLFQKLSMEKKESDPVAASVVFQFVVAAIILVFALFKGFTLPVVSLWPYIAVSGILYAFGTVSFFKAYKYIGASEVAVVGGAGVIVTVIASYLFLNDTLSIVQLTGVILILTAVVIVNLKRARLKLNTGALLTLLGSSLYGLGVVIDTYIISRFDAVSYLPVIFTVTGGVILILYPRHMKSVALSFMRVDKNLMLFNIFYAITSVSYYSAIESGALVSQVSAILRASIILTVVMATVFLNEKENLGRKFTAAILTTAGVIMVTT